MIFQDRREAGRILAARLRRYANRPHVIVLAVPRGGVPVAFEVARALHVPLDVFLVRKLGVPGHEELAMGAIASGGARFLNEETIRARQIPYKVIDQVTVRERRELDRQERAYREGRPALKARGRDIILVDDGLATGSTMRAAIFALRQQRPVRIIVAVPVGAADMCAALRTDADEIVCAVEPEPFYAVGEWYHDFSQTTDAEVNELLRQATNDHLLLHGNGAAIQ